MKHILLSSHLIMIILLLSVKLSAQQSQLAFPGAEGFGKYTTGGRSGIVIEVTNLNDSGPGSLRNAIAIDTPRTIIFKVSGIIPLQSELFIEYGNLTIAGQTAPGDGICLKNYAMVLQANNVIVRYMRFRTGAAMKKACDGLTGKMGENVIIDHCSMSWANDENGSFYDNRNFTMQWCIISESLNNSTHPKGKHGYGAIWGGKNATFHHNLFAHNTNRNPRFCGNRYKWISGDEIVDFRNNIIFNWSANSVYGGENGYQNMVANYYKPGPATHGQLRYRIVEPYFDFYNPRINKDTVPLGKWYIAENFVEGYPDVTTNNWKGVYGLSPEQIAQAQLTKPAAFEPISQHTPQEAFITVMKQCGATLPKRDPVDARIIKEVETGIPTFGTDMQNAPGIIDSPEQVGGWPQYNSAPAPADTDHDGMPDAWELKQNFNPNDSSDRNGDTNKNGYTDLEDYLNSL